MLRTEPLILRKPRLDDAEALVEAVGDPETMRYVADGSTSDLDGARRALEKMRSARVAETIGERYERDVEVRGVPTRLYVLER